MPRKNKKKMSTEVKLRCPTCNQHFKQVHDYDRHLKSKRHIRGVTVNQAKSKKVNRKLAHELSRAASFPVPKLCLKCVCLKTSNNLTKYCKIGKGHLVKSWIDQKIEEAYFKTDCSFPEKKRTKSNFWKKFCVYYCHICNVPLSSLKASKDHYSREMHLKNILKMIKNQLSCDLCGRTTVLFNMEEKVSMRECKTKIKYETFEEDTFATDFKTEYIETDVATEDEKGESSVKTECFSNRESSDELFKTEVTQKIEYTENDLKTNCFESDLKTLKVDTDMKKEFLKLECFGTDIKAEHIETNIKTELIRTDIKMERLNSDVKADYVESFNIKMECFDEEVKAECIKNDVKTEYIERDIKTETDESPAVKVNHYQCGVCDVRFSSPKVFKAHYIDDAHVKKLVGMIQKEESFYCPFCDYSTTNDVTFKKHLDDQLHIYELKLQKPKRNNKTNSVLRK